MGHYPRCEVCSSKIYEDTEKCFKCNNCCCTCREIDIDKELYLKEQNVIFAVHHFVKELTNPDNGTNQCIHWNSFEELVKALIDLGYDSFGSN